MINAQRMYFKDINTIINIAFYIKGGFHNQLDYRFYRTEEPVYNFSGAAAEMMRTDSLYYDKTFDEIFNHYLNLASSTDGSFIPSVRKSIRQSLDELAVEFNILDKKSKDLFDLIFTETRCRNHFGKFSIAEYFTNKIFFTPMVDPDLHKLKITTDECDDKYLLYTLIFVRYCPKLLDFKVEGNRKFNEKTIEYAEKINSLKPFEQKELNFVSGPSLIKKRGIEKENFVWEDVDSYLKKVYKTKLFENEFKRIFPETLYNKILYSMENTVYFPLGAAYPVFHILKTLDSIEYKNNYDFAEWLESFIKKNHKHIISDIDGLNNALIKKSNISHIHENFSINQIRVLQKLLSNDLLFKEIKFKSIEKYFTIGDVIKFSDIEIFDLDNNPINFDKNELNIVVDEDHIFSFRDLSINKNDEKICYEFPISLLGYGKHSLCLKYKESFSDDVVVYVKENKNLFNFNIFSGSDYFGELNGFDGFQVKSISSSTEWSEIGERSVKVICDGSNNYQALTIEGQDVNIGDLISASVTIYNPEGNVFVRLFESSVNSFTTIEVPQSDFPQNIVLDKIATSKRMQLLIYSRTEQTFYADNFSFCINNEFII